LPFFDFANEVRMGLEFWDFIGGDGTYDELLAIYAQVGEDFAREIDALRVQ
jgi:Type II restriction endonuclease, TdeIII